MIFISLQNVTSLLCLSVTVLVFRLIIHTFVKHESFIRALFHVPMQETDVPLLMCHLLHSSEVLQGRWQQVRIYCNCVVQ